MVVPFCDLAKSQCPHLVRCLMLVGCGAYWHGQWFQVAWDSMPIARAGITPKEFFPILVAGVIWGHNWRGATVCAHCDNMALVEIIMNKKAKEILLCHQLRALFFISTFYDFELTATHTLGQENGAADALSRNAVSSFLSQVPTTSRLPTHVPLDLCLGLSTAQPCWKSPDWITWFSSILTRH